MSRTKPTPKRSRSSREAWHPPRDRKELIKAIGAAAAVVVLSLGAVLFLGRDHLGSGSSTPTTPLPTGPVGSATTPSTPTIPGTTPPATAPAGKTPAPTGGSATSTTAPGAPAP